MSKKITPPSDIKGLPLAIVKQMITLSTAGFGLVAALAWNEVVKEVVETRIKPYFDGTSGLISLLIYALLITILAVLVTYQLTKIEARLEAKLPTCPK